jgi:signal transduction histidine kinase
MLKVDAGELIGTHFQDFILDDQKQRFEALMTGAHDNAAREQFELKTSGTECVPVQLSMYRLGDDPTGAVSIIATDITERVHAEQKIRALISELTMAEQDERQRISEILHDDLQQRLFAIKAQLSFLQEPGPDSNAGSTQKELEQVQAYLSDAINIARNLSVDLSPMILQGEGLAEALVWLNAQMKRRYGLDVELLADHDLRSMDKSLRMLIFQAVREFLFNVVKHSDQLKATISLLKDGSSDLVIVKDEGKGFDPEMVLSDQALAHGLLLIKNRLALIGCSMEVQSAPGEGTSILIRIPIEAA